MYEICKTLYSTTESIFYFRPSRISAHANSMCVGGLLNPTIIRGIHALAHQQRQGTCKAYYFEGVLLWGSAPSTQSCSLRRGCLKCNDKIPLNDVVEISPSITGLQLRFWVATIEYKIDIRYQINFTHGGPEP